MVKRCVLNKKLFEKLSDSFFNKLKAFSVAEAMIALLIGSIALGMAAPMITKQIKQNNFSDTQFQVINRDANNLRELVNDLVARVEELENAQSSIAKGTVVFFDSNAVNSSAGNNGCPNGFTNISSDKVGKYIMLDSNLNAGKINKADFPNHRHVIGYIPSSDNDTWSFYMTNIFKSKAASSNSTWLDIGPDGHTSRSSTTGVGFNQMLVTSLELINDKSKNTNEIEVKPASLSLIACRKN